MAEQRDGKSWLSRLARDVRGNTLAITAAAMVPLCGLIGGAVDASRMYLTKTRLQHACDAGTLAGRKAMGGGQWSQNNGAPNATALRFFDANFGDGAYGTTGRTRAFSESAGKVTGTVSATVPMTLMRVLAVPDQTITVTCDAELRLPNTDVMFVLDTTGSMATADAGGGQTRIDALKVAVKCFYEIVAKLDTDATCSTGTPSGGTGNSVQIRFGFVPYATNVNVGKLLPTEYFANSWQYQSRARTNIYGTFNSFDNNSLYNAGTWTGYTTTESNTTSNNSTQCSNSFTVPGDSYTFLNIVGWPFSENATSWKSQAAYTRRQWRTNYTSNTKLCELQWREQYVERRVLYDRATQTTANAITFPAWDYRPVSLDVSGLKAGSGVNWNNSVNLPIGDNFTTMAATWDGCIEERPTVRQTTSYWPIPSGAYDLNLDLVPSQGNANSLWGPALPQVIYPRRDGIYSNSGAYTQTTFTSTNQNFTNDVYACPAEARKMLAWPDASSFSSYVNSLSPGGNTYHDIGLLWGARLMWPTGMFASENALTPQGGEIERHLILMTDGDPCTDVDNYQAYGISWFDRRTTDPSVAPTQGCTTTGTLTQQVNLRTDAICTAIKNKNITLWVVTFGSVSSNTVTRMTACATPGRYFNATSATTLQQTFASIANQISQLRLTR